MDTYSYAKQSVGWKYLSIAKRQVLGMDKYFRPTRYNVCYYVNPC